MQTVRIHTRLESENLTLPQLRPLIGKQVEITVCEAPEGNGNHPSDPSAAGRYRLRGSVLRYDDPFAPALEAGEWEAAR